MKIKDNEWSRNGKGDKPRTNTWESKWQDNYDEIDWSAHRKQKKKKRERDQNDN